MFDWGTFLHNLRSLGRFRLFELYKSFHILQSLHFILYSVGQNSSLVYSGFIISIISPVPVILAMCLFEHILINSFALLSSALIFVSHPGVVCRGYFGVECDSCSESSETETLSTRNSISGWFLKVMKFLTILNIDFIDMCMPSCCRFIMNGNVSFVLSVINIICATLVINLFVLYLEYDWLMK